MTNSSKPKHVLGAPGIVWSQKLPDEARWNGLYVMQSVIDVVHPNDAAAQLRGRVRFEIVGSKGAYVYVMSPHSGGQIRWYWRREGETALWLLPSWPHEWDELDNAVEKFLGGAVFTYGNEP